MFYSGRIRPLVPKATYIFHGFIIGKLKIDLFSVTMRIFGIYFYRSVYRVQFIWLLSKSLKLFAGQGDKNGKFKVKMFKNLLFKDRLVYKADTFHMCL